MSRATPGAASLSSDASSPARNAAPLETIALDGANRTGQDAIASAGDHVDVLLENGGAVLATSMHATVATSVTNRSPEFRIGTPIGSNHWESAVGNTLVMMSGGQHDRAELVLTPPQLGRIEVSLSMRGDDASLTFVSSNPVVREALENALPRLREILADAGISLGQTQVGSESPGQTAKDSQNRDNSPGNAISDFPVGDTLQQDSAGRENTTLRRVTLALVDTYA
jgi:flagellar hook-length control protein FliK